MIGTLKRSADRVPGVVSHELREPPAAVKGSATTLLEGAGVGSGGRPMECLLIPACAGETTLSFPAVARQSG